MHTFRSRASRPFATAACAAIAVVGLLLAALAGCSGGGEGGDGVGSGGTGTYSMGPISGFGSIVVNGVRYDDSVAVVLDEDDAPRERAALRLGTIVEVDAGDVRVEAGVRRATARRVRVAGALVGPVEALDAGAGTLVVLGQTVKVGAGTVFDERLSGGLAALVPGHVVEVHALYDPATARHAATRVEPAGPGAAWQVRGQVEAVDAAARTLRIGGAGFAYGTAGGAPAAIAAGDTVRLRVRDGADAQGRRPVESFLAGSRAPEDRDRGEIEGTVTAFASPASFRVGALPVDASAATFPDGTSGLRLGARVHLEGAVRAGVLHARAVRISGDDEIEDRGFELDGRITALDARARRFVLRGQTVDYGRADLRVDGGTLADLAVGRRVEVRARPSADRSVLEATRLEFDE